MARTILTPRESVPCAEWISLPHFLDSPLPRTPQPRLTTLAFARTPTSSHQCPYSWHSVCILIRSTLSFLSIPELLPVHFPLHCQFPLLPTPQFTLSWCPPGRQSHVGSSAVGESQMLSTQQLLSRTLHLCPQNTPEPAPASKDQAAATSGRDPALGEGRSSEVAGECGAPSFSKILEAREGELRQGRVPGGRGTAEGWGRYSRAQVPSAPNLELLLLHHQPGSHAPAAAVSLGPL